MTIENLLKNGYFSEELPPPFNSESLAANYKKIQKIISALPPTEEKKLRESNFVNYSVPKVGIHRRQQGISNPYHQILLSESIVKNWKSIVEHYKKSTLSASIPEIRANSKRAVVQFEKYEIFKENCIEASFDTQFELRADISKYFPSIYTHSIPWAIHTKKVAKMKRTDKSLYGNVIDEHLRFCQNGQTIGIPIGSDTSRIIAEIIGCSMDEALITQLSKEKIKIKGCRFVDDSHFFFYSQADAEIALKYYQKILNDYNLNINEEKTFIRKAPFFFENNWSHQLTSFQIRVNHLSQRRDLRNYFDLIKNLSQQNPNDSVIKYGTKILKKQKIAKSNWELFESLMYSLAISEGTILPDLLAVLLQNSKHVNLKKLEAVIISLLGQHVYKGNHFEVSWTLWIARSFKIKIPLDIAQTIINSRDIISIILILDLRMIKLVSSKLDDSEISAELHEEGLKGEYWLLVYEASHKGWISSSALSKLQFFEKLSKAGVSFYDPSRQLSVDNPNIIADEEKESNGKPETKDKVVFISEY